MQQFGQDKRRTQKWRRNYNLGVGIIVPGYSDLTNRKLRRFVNRQLTSPTKLYSQWLLEFFLMCFLNSILMKEAKTRCYLTFPQNHLIAANWKATVNYYIPNLWFSYSQFSRKYLFCNCNVYVNSCFHYCPFVEQVSGIKYRKVCLVFWALSSNEYKSFAQICVKLRMPRAIRVNR